MPWYGYLVLVVGLLGLAVVALRVRKLRRDARRRLWAETPRHLKTPPPSPYERAPGFRIIGGESTPTTARHPSAPRIDHDSDEPFVFSDLTMPGAEDVAPIVGRHDERWALERAVESPGASVGRLVVIGAIVAVVLVLVLVALSSGH